MGAAPREEGVSFSSKKKALPEHFYPVCAVPSGRRRGREAFVPGNFKMFVRRSH